MTNKKTQVSRFRSELEALAKGYSKYPKALKGVRGALSQRDVTTNLRRLTQLEKAAEKAEAIADKKRNEIQKIANQNNAKLVRTKKLIRIYLAKAKKEDFLLKKAKKKKATKKK